ncbi:proteasome regulatory particle base subunit rpn10 [Yamadazyma tenuis]|uniref:VWA-like protein n=1 Tax=Candida tenuis (strain ATCC 10573 / BCRC 21748 / CBS 615 / JCM 9827 / NBRC 10315 / NRRL Y-1498 / VKM Y-70) TaxID=590646 RepID=G3BFL1_CANTC|nr:vWA-like protein [Yamadazyma tenuis ATCC 10573]EGV60043.1 vWA-like protein [Yamadazyma tenuis ATCC 10573]WEJ94730.1 proteasome regulatory particle base subunit rpn10 [Yamadazyma tenuis]
MVLEATMIAIDNSEYMRNEDYPTSRYEAQLSATEYIFQNKVNSNPENTVGLLAYGGNGPEVLSTLTTDFGKILSGAHETKVHGGSHFSSGIQVAALALKHRQNKVQNQRIIVFVGSPITESEKDLEKLAKKMKKNNIAIDVVNFGEESINTSKLEKFNNAINNHDNSHLVTIPPGPRLLYEIVATSPILMEEGYDMDNGDLGGGMDGFGGGDLIDPNMDPDLALALRLSLEEERARQEREALEQEKAEKPELDKIDEDQ